MSRPRQSERPKDPRRVSQIIHDLRYRVLPELEREFLAAHDYASGRRDRPSNEQNEFVTGGGTPSDPTGDIASEQERNRSRLRDVAEGIARVKSDAESLLGRLKSVFDVYEPDSPHEPARIPTIKEQQAYKDAVRAKETERLRAERSQLERRMKEIDRIVEDAS